ncbi:hypothetical protein [Sorangium sp. So ce1000]|uniref:hypothetical protein n=1 Tax=Sorangium sp. So ce1000 TaxID=3133325 RepID=UPI003F611EBE
MKKLIVLAALATMSFSGSAMAIAPTSRVIRIEGVQAGTGVFVFRFADGSHPLLAPNGSCAYDLRWTSNNPLLGTLVCRVLEATTSTNPACMANRGSNIDSLMTAGDNFTSCSGFNEFNMPFGPQAGLPNSTMFLGESATGIAVGIINTNTFPFLGAEGITFTPT